MQSFVQSECAHGLRPSSSCEAYACQEGQQNHASKDGHERHDCFRSCESIDLRRYLMSTVKPEEVASEASVTLQDPDRRPVRLFLALCSHG